MQSDLEKLSFVLLYRPEIRGAEMKVMSGIFLLMCMPLGVAGSNEAYPKEKIAEFVVEKLDLTSIAPAIGPKREKGKRTFGDYGYVTRKLDDNEALVEAPQGSSRVGISVLEESKSGIYVCLNAQAEKQSTGPIQRVFLLKLKNNNGLLKGRESWKEFDSCPVIGGADDSSATDAYGGD
jgi:hypothetical protein